MLPLQHRLKGKKDISNLFRFGKTFSSDVLIMKVIPIEKDKPIRFGFGASVKYSKKAVERNKAKRWMREAVRAEIKNINSGWNIIFFVNPKFPKRKITLDLIQEKTKSLLKKAKIL